MKKARYQKNVCNYLRLFFMIAIIIGTVAAVFLVKKNQDLRKSADFSADTMGKRYANLDVSTAFYPWKDWYPIDHGQPEGYRLLNFVSTTSSRNTTWYGHAPLNIPDPPSTLPAAYNGNDINYFKFMQCAKPMGDPTDPNCMTTKYEEIISQGSAFDPIGGTTLEHWARGNKSAWEVYYDPQKIGFDNCNGTKIANPAYGFTQAKLENPDLKKPWVLKLPRVPDTVYVSEPICALVFKGFYQRPSSILDMRSNTSGAHFTTGNWISVTINHQYTTDKNGLPVVHAENIYLTDNTASSGFFNREYCAKYPTDYLHCPEGRPLSITKDGRTYRAFNFEEYWMRKTSSTGRYPGIIDKFGFGAFKYWSNPGTEWDRNRNDGSVDTKMDGADNQVYVLQKCSLDRWGNATSCVNQ